METPMRVTFLGPLLFFASFAGAATKSTVVDRTAMAEAALAAFPRVMQYVISQKDFEKIPFGEQRVLLAIELVASKMPSELVFVDDPAQFVVAQGEPARLMRTDNNMKSPIYVNRTLLNSA